MTRLYFQMASWLHLADLTQIPRIQRALSSSRTRYRKFMCAQIDIIGCLRMYFLLTYITGPMLSVQIADLLRHQ